MPEREPYREGQEPHEMSNERFRQIYNLLKDTISDREISEFAKKYLKEGNPIQKAQRQEQQEFQKEQEDEQERLESKVKDMTNEELAAYSEKYYGRYWKHIEELQKAGEDPAIGLHDAFKHELERRLAEREEVERLKSQIPIEQQKPAHLEVKLKEEKKPETKWWQFWK